MKDVSTTPNSTTIVIVKWSRLLDEQSQQQVHDHERRGHDGLQSLEHRVLRAVGRLLVLEQRRPDVSAELHSLFVVRHLVEQREQCWVYQRGEEEVHREPDAAEHADVGELRDAQQRAQSDHQHLEERVAKERRPHSLQRVVDTLVDRLVLRESDERQFGESVAGRHVRQEEEERQDLVQRCHTSSVRATHQATLL